MVRVRFGGREGALASALISRTSDAYYVTLRNPKLYAHWRAIFYTIAFENPTEL